MRAAVVLPTPRIPVNRKACAIRPRLSACASVRVTCSWPTSSPKRSGRHLRASTRCDERFESLTIAAVHVSASKFCPSNDSQAPLRHRKLAGTVASFRTWRGSRRSLAQDPAISGGQFFTLLQIVAGTSNREGRRQGHSLPSVHAPELQNLPLNYRSDRVATASNGKFIPNVARWPIDDARRLWIFRLSMPGKALASQSESPASSLSNF